MDGGRGEGGGGVGVVGVWRGGGGGGGRECVVKWEEFGERGGGGGGVVGWGGCEGGGGVRVYRVRVWVLSFVSMFALFLRGVWVGYIWGGKNRIESGWRYGITMLERGLRIDTCNSWGDEQAITVHSSVDLTLLNPSDQTSRTQKPSCLPNPPSHSVDLPARDSSDNFNKTSSPPFMRRFGGLVSKTPNSVQLSRASFFVPDYL